MHDSEEHLDAYAGATPANGGRGVDRVYRLGSILALAEEAIGDRKKAQLWLRQSNQALSGEFPIRALDMEIGTRRVEQVLGRIAYGGLS